MPDEGLDCRFGNETGVDRIGVDGQFAIGNVDIPKPITDDLALVDIPYIPPIGEVVVEDGCNEPSYEDKPLVK